MSRYNDIINLPHHVSPTRQRMSMHDRAAQFAPFAALVGYDAAVAEIAIKNSAKIKNDQFIFILQENPFWGCVEWKTVCCI